MTIMTKYMYVNLCIHILCSVPLTLCTMPGGNGDIEVSSGVGYQPDVCRFSWIMYWMKLALNDKISLARQDRFGSEEIVSLFIFYL